MRRGGLVASGSIRAGGDIGVIRLLGHDREALKKIAGGLFKNRTGTTWSVIFAGSVA